MHNRYGVKTNSDQPLTSLEARLRYAARGWETFPAKLSGKVKKSNAGIGIVTGAKSGIFVVEADTAEGHGKDGIAALKALEDKYGPLPLTLMAMSPSGSVHYYFNWPSGASIINTTSKIADGVDVRGDGGMVVAPPTVTPKGTYRWMNDAPVADAPQWLIDLAKDETSSDNVVNFPTPPDWLRELMERKPKLAGLGVSTDADDLPPKPAVNMAELRAALSTVDPNVYDNWFACMAALKTDLGEDGRALALEWTKAGEGSDWQTRRLDRFDEKWTKDLGRNTAAGKKHLGLIFHLANKADLGWRDGLARDEGPSTPEPKTAEETKRVKHATLHWATDGPPLKKRWRVKNTLPMIGTGNCVAVQYAGKTFVGLRIAHDLWFEPKLFGRKIMKRCATLWIATESPNQIPVRLQGLPHPYGSWPMPWIRDDKDGPLPKLLDRWGRIDMTSVDYYIASINHAREEIRARSPDDDLGLTIFDTMIRVSGYGSGGESDPSQCANVWHALTLISEATETFCLGMDHMGWDRTRSRGGSSKEDNPDVIIYIEQIAGGVGKQINFKKIRDDVAGWGLGFAIKSVAIGIDEDGEVETTGCAEWLQEGLIRPTKPEKEPVGVVRLMKALSQTPTRSWPCPVEELREAHKQVYRTLEFKESVEREAWRRLLENGDLQIKDDLAYDRFFSLS
jgi:hypothetical protein